MDQIKVLLAKAESHGCSSRCPLLGEMPMTMFSKYGLQTDCSNLLRANLVCSGFGLGLDPSKKAQTRDYGTAIEIHQPLRSFLLAVLSRGFAWDSDRALSILG